MNLEERNAVLDQAKALILAGWCQGALARDAFGSVIQPERAEAVAFCAVGAVFRVAEIGQARRAGNALKSALVLLGFEPKIGRYNDAPGRTKYEVAAIFDHAKEQPL